MWLAPLWSVSLLVVKAMYRALSNPLSNLSGQWYTKWTGVEEKYYYMKGKKNEYIHALHQKYGEYHVN